MKHIDRPQVVTLKVVKNLQDNQQGDENATSGQSLPDLLTKLDRSLVHDVKSSLACLLQMTTQVRNYSQILVLPHVLYFFRI